MNATELATKMLEWETTQRVADALRAEIEVAGDSSSSTGATAPDVEIDPEWTPPAGLASVVLVNDAGEDIVMAIAGEEYAVASGAQLVITLDPGVYDYNATDPRYDPFESTCEVEADSIYYWYSDDSDWGSCKLIWPTNE